MFSVKPFLRFYYCFHFASLGPEARLEPKDVTRSIFFSHPETAKRQAASVFTHDPAEKATRPEIENATQSIFFAHHPAQKVQHNTPKDQAIDDTVQGKTQSKTQVVPPEIDNATHSVFFAHHPAQKAKRNMPKDQANNGIAHNKSLAARTEAENETQSIFFAHHLAVKAKPDKSKDWVVNSTARKIQRASKETTTETQSIFFPHHPAEKTKLDVSKGGAINSTTHSKIQTASPGKENQTQSIFFVHDLASKAKPDVSNELANNGTAQTQTQAAHPEPENATWSIFFTHHPAEKQQRDNEQDGAINRSTDSKAQAAGSDAEHHTQSIFFAHHEAGQVKQSALKTHAINRSTNGMTQAARPKAENETQFRFSTHHPRASAQLNTSKDVEVTNSTHLVIVNNFAHHSSESAKRHTTKHRVGSNADAKKALTDFETGVTASAAEAVSAYDKISSWCAAQKQALANAADSQATKSGELYTVITEKAGLRSQIKAELMQVRHQLAEQQTSKSSTMTQQYALQTELQEKQTELEQRSAVMEDVMKKMKEKAFAADAVQKAGAFLTTATGISTVGSSKSPLSTLMGVLTQIQQEIEDDLAKTKDEQKQKRAEYDEILIAFQNEINTLEKSTETHADRLSMATSLLTEAKLERDARQGLEKEDNELLMAVTTVCSEADFAKKKKEKVYEQFAADLKDARALLETTFLMLRQQSRQAISIPNAKVSAVGVQQGLAGIRSMKTTTASQTKATQARQHVSMSQSMRRLRRQRTARSPTPQECKNDRDAATADLNTARYDVQYIGDDHRKEEASETAYFFSAHAIAKATEVDDLRKESATLKKDVEDFSAAGKKEAETAKADLDTADTEVAAYFDSIDKPSEKAAAQVLLRRMRETLKEWVDDGLDDLIELAKMLGAIGDRAVEIQDSRTTRASDLLDASKAAKARKDDLQVSLDSAKTRLSDAKDELDKVEKRCTASLLSTSLTKTTSNLQALASQSHPWKFNGHVMPGILQKVMNTLGI